MSAGETATTSMSGFPAPVWTSANSSSIASGKTPDVLGGPLVDLMRLCAAYRLEDGGGSYHQRIPLSLERDARSNDNPRKTE